MALLFEITHYPYIGESFPSDLEFSANELFDFDSLFPSQISELAKWAPGFDSADQAETVNDPFLLEEPSVDPISAIGTPIRVAQPEVETRTITSPSALTANLSESVDAADSDSQEDLTFSTEIDISTSAMNKHHETDPVAATETHNSRSESPAEAAADDSYTQNSPSSSEKARHSPEGAASEPGGEVSEIDVDARMKLKSNVITLRRRLEKGLLTTTEPPKKEDMSNMSRCLEKVEQLDNLEFDILCSTGIENVIKKISQLDKLPEKGYHIKERAILLYNGWKLVGMNTNSPSSPVSTLESRSTSVSSPNTDGQLSPSWQDSVRLCVERPGKIESPKVRKSGKVGSESSRRINKRKTRTTTSARSYVDQERLRLDRVVSHLREVIAADESEQQLVKARQTKILGDMEAEIKALEDARGKFVALADEQIDLWKRKRHQMEEESQDHTLERSKRQKLKSLEQEIMAWNTEQQQVTGEWESR